MRQTNNAIKFLIAQYRAIFKNANLAMAAKVAKVAAVAAALTVSAAHAAANDVALDSADEWTKALTDGKGTITITGKDTDKGTEGKFQKLTVTTDAAAVELALKKGEKLVVTGALADNTLKTGGNKSGTLTISGLGDLEIGGVNNGSTKQGLTITADSGAISSNVTKLNVQSTLDLKTSTSQTASNYFVAQDVVVGDGQFKAGAADAVEGLASINIGSTTGSGGVGLGAGTMTINKDGRVVLAAINGQDQSDTDGSDLKAGKISINGGVLSFGEAVQGGESWISADVIEINEGGILSTSATSSTQVDRGVELNPGGSMHVNNGGHVVLGSKMGFDYGDMYVHDGGTLAASTDAGELAIGTPNDSSDSAVVHLSSAKLKSFLTGKDGSAALKYRDESKIYDADANNDFSNATQGKVNLMSGGTIFLTDAAALDLADKTIFNFNSASTLQAGTIAVNGGAIRAENLLVSKAIENATNLKVGAKNLTLGSKDYEGTNALGVHSLHAENVTFVNNKSKDAFTLKNNLALETANSGTINGNVDVDGGRLVIDAGNYTINGNIKLTSGQSTSPGTTMLPAFFVDNGDAYVQVNGKLTTTTNGKVEIEDGVLDLRGATLAVAAQTINLTDIAELYVDGSKFIKASGDAVTFDTAKFAENAVTGDNMSTFNIDGIGSLTLAQFKDLQSKTKFGGSFQGFNVTGVDAGGSKNFSADTLTGTPDSVYGATQMVVGEEIKKTYSFGGIKLSSGDKLTIGKDSTGSTVGAVKLTNAGVNANGNFVQKADGSTADVHLAAQQATLKLIGTGKVGNVTTVAPSNAKTEHEYGYFIIGDAHKYGSSDVTVAGSIGSSTAIMEGVMVSPGSKLTVNGTSIDVRGLYVTQGASLIAPKASITVKHLNTTQDNAYSEAEILGDIVAKDLNIATAGDTNGTGHIFAGGSTVKLSGALTLGAGVHVQIGSDDVAGLGSSVVVDTLDMGSGSSLYVDPPYNKKASALIVKNLKDGSITGSLTVGQNALTAIGFADEASALSVVADYLDANGSFRADGKVKNALVLNKGITIGDKAKIVLDPSGNTQGNTGGVAVTKGAGLIITDAAVTDPATGKKTKPAISLSSGKQVTIDASTPVLFSGKFTAADVADLKIFDGTNIQIDNPINGQSVNGIMSFVIDKNGKVSEIKLDADKLNSQMAGTAAPIRDLLDKILGANSADYITDSKAAGYNFLSEMATNSTNGHEIDAAAHAATYAGAQVAAVAAVGTMAEAINGRLGAAGVESSAIAATGSATAGGVWISPTYKSVDADGFDAQGGTYGADVDLAGVTFGVDSVMGDVRFGAALNIGSGDADGKGNGNGLKDEFDYYGVGVYTSMAFGDISVIGDASYNVISHDVKGFTGSKNYGDVNASADTMAITMGVTGQYFISTEMVDVVPHAGVRYTRLDTDSYDMNTTKGGNLGSTDFDVQNVFSIPVGVSVAKTMQYGDWTFAPSADMTITFNAGDTEARSSVKFSGVNVNTVLDTEVLDKVTYGLNLGLGMQNGNFGTSVGFNYTGSSNVDSLGINANARYMF